MVGQFYLGFYFARGLTQTHHQTTRSAGGRADTGRGQARMSRNFRLGDHADGQGRERVQELRRAQGAQGASRWKSAGSGARPSRALGIGQVDVPAVHQPPRGGQRRPAPCRRRPDRATARRAANSEMPQREAAKQRRDIGMVFQHFNLFPHRTALANIIEAPIQVKGVSRRPRPSHAPKTCSSRWDFRRRPPRIQPNCLAASSSGWRSRARWR